MHECEELELADLETWDRVASVHRATEVVRATPEQIFDVFEDAGAWSSWATAITYVEWTSPFPLVAGSTRRVTMLGGLVAEETFLAYERGSRMAFRFDRVSKPMVEAFAEDYRVTPVGDGRSVVDWTMGLTPAGAGAKATPVTAPLMTAGLRYMLKRLRREVEAS